MKISLLFILLFMSCVHKNSKQYPDDRISLKQRTLNKLNKQIENAEAIFVFKCSLQGEDEFPFNKKKYKGEIIYISTAVNKNDKELLNCLKNSFYIDLEKYPVLKPYPSYFILILGAGFKYKISISKNFMHYMISEKEEIAFGGTIKESKRDSITKILERINE